MGQIGTTVLNLVISSAEAEGGQIHLNVVMVLRSSKNSTGTKIGFVGVNIFYREHALAYPNTSFETCGGPDALTSATIFMTPIWTFPTMNNGK